MYGSVERQLECLGATAVEDQLQDEVPETVQFLLAAGIVLWVLTGDKLETARTIALSSSILNPSMAIATVDASEPSAVAAQVAAACALVGGEGGKALVIGGAALATVMAVDAPGRSHAQLIELCKQCRVVVCARCAPVQKAEVVKLVKTHLGKVTLAIGDGGNDVPMILSAHVGVGIAGNEGMQAARSADFAIGEFRKLRKLLAVHGRWNNIRVTDLIKYSLYKNVTFCLPQVASPKP